MCGTNPQCSSTNYLDTTETDPRDNPNNNADYATNNILGVQHRETEVCELITEYYDPLYVLNHPLMKNEDNNQYILTYDDGKGKHLGTYQCLGT